eukprot:TRINITY_DN11883_c0_g1_i4.p1 TRINITY_DN11883_c0_g1~~TRINITY_DN11883_c0_g1_i4.p1  ORF type:complete len:438 (+),score=88.99 TRINITY_DN11883_c0_g1_i4:53-1315(+)
MSRQTHSMMRAQQAGNGCQQPRRTAVRRACTFHEVGCEMASRHGWRSSGPSKGNSIGQRTGMVAAAGLAALSFLQRTRPVGLSQHAAGKTLPPNFVVCKSTGGRAAPRKSRLGQRAIPEMSALAEQSWMNDPIVSCVGWAALISGLTVLRVATANDESHTPSTFLKRKRSSATGASQDQPVVCLGDSITRGNLSADWVSDLRQAFDGRTVLNAGINMQCSKNIQQRIDEVIACCPSHVTLLVGTNDLKAELSPVEGFLYKIFGSLPEVPTLESYEETLMSMREKLLAAGVSVALVSPPVLGEDVRSEANRRAAEFAAVVRRVAEGGGEKCSYLPLFEQTYAALPEVGGKPYCGMNFFVWCCLLCWDVHILQRDLAEIQRERQLGVTIDLVHLGPEAAQNLAGMVHDFVAGNAQGPALAEA